MELKVFCGKTEKIGDKRAEKEREREKKYESKTDKDIEKDSQTKKVKTDESEI